MIMKNASFKEGIKSDRTAGEAIKAGEPIGYDGLIVTNAANPTFGIALETVSLNEKVPLQVEGIVCAPVTAAAGATYNAGQLLMIGGSAGGLRYLTAHTGVNKKVAIVMDAVTFSANTPAWTWVKLICEA